MQSSANTNLSKEFEKCGTILTALQVGKQIYALNCIFCGKICLQLETFAVHMEENHQDQLYNSVQLSEETHVEILDEEVENIHQHINKKRKLARQHRSTNIEILEEECEVSTQNIDFQDVENTNCTLLKDETEEMYEEHIIPDFVASNENINEDEESNSECDDYKPEECYEKETDALNSDAELEEILDDDEEETTDDQQITLAIIAGFKKHEILWDENRPMAKNRRKHERAYVQIATTVNNQLDLRLKWQDIRECIKKIRLKARRELKALDIAKLKKENYTPIWYYEKVSFFTQSIKTLKPRNKKTTPTAVKLDKPSLPMTDLTNEQNHELIEIYKSFPILWDAQHISFRMKNQRQDALDEMLLTVNSSFSWEITLDDLQKRIYRMRHACTQEKTRKLHCESTNEEKYIPLSKLHENISFLEPSIGPFKCDICGEILNGYDQYKIHRAEHDGTMPFICPLCDRGFNLASNCTVHLRRHLRDYNFECGECGKRFATSTDRTVHVRMHTGEKPYCCDICGKSFRTWYQFDPHVRRHQKRPKFQCKLCPKAFYKQSDLAGHMKVHLNVRDKVCDICDKTFTTNKHLRQHKQIHSAIKQYVCKICGKEFAQCAGLNSHMKSHGTTIKGAPFNKPQLEKLQENKNDSFAIYDEEEEEQNDLS